MWRALEPYHAVTYFAPESREVTDALGCTGGWMSYFALRAAPLGAAPPELVAALFYNFHPHRVARAVPAAWRAADPTEFVAARLEAVDRALRRLLGDRVVESPAVAEAASLAREAAAAAPLAGRALAAANAALAWPDEPHLVLWHAQTVLRESRGDGHVAALVSAELDPCETLVLFTAAGRAEAGAMRGWRGWSEPEWADARARLERRGLVDPAGGLTGAGAALRDRVERCTDRGAMASWEAIGQVGCDRLVDLTRPLVVGIVRGGGLQEHNPMGLRPLV
jgi:hypothetical protein